MSHNFKCLDWEGKRHVELEGSCSARSVTGNGTPGLFIRVPKGASFIPADEFCWIIQYFLSNYDLEGKDDPRLALVKAIKEAETVTGHNGPRSRRLEISFESLKETVSHLQEDL